MSAPAGGAGHEWSRTDVVIIDERRPRGGDRGLFWFLLILSLPYVVGSLNIDGFVALLPLVRDEFALSRTQVGLYTTFFFSGAALLAIFAGRLVDRLGSRRGLVAGLFVLGASVLLYGLAPTYVVLLAFATLAGLGISIITPSINAGVLGRVPRGKRATFLGIMQSGIGVGGVAGASLLPALAVNVGWRSAVGMTGVATLLLAVVILVAYREGSDVKAAPSADGSLRDDLGALLRNPGLLRTCCLGTLYGSLGSSAVFHYTVFLSEDIGVTVAFAGLGLAALHVGGMVGRPFWGWISDNAFGGDRPRTLLTLGLVIAGLFLVAGIAPYKVVFPLPLTFTLSILLGLSAFSWIPVYFISVGEMAEAGREGTATGLAMVFNRIGTVMAPPLFGLMADLTGSYQVGWLALGALALLVAPLLYRRPGRVQEGDVDSSGQ